jgi:tetratricopeptide (TPR) repeat protein
VIALAASVALLRATGSQAPAPAAREDAYRANNVGVAYLEQYNHEEAAKSFRRALELDPTLAMARVNLAIALFYVPDLAGSMKEAQAAAAADPKAPQPHYILGLIAKSENRVDDAVAELRQVLAIDNADLGARVNLAQLLMQRREYDEAITLLEPAVAAEPYHVTAKYNLGVALTRGGKTERGQQVMAEFQKLREGGYGTTFSNNYLEQGRYAEAIASTGAEDNLVDKTTPKVTFAAAQMIEATPGPPATDVTNLGALARADIGSGLTLADLDRDGDLDLVDVTAGRLRLFVNARGTFTDATAKLAPIKLPEDVVPSAAVAGDYDNDERIDLAIVGPGGPRLWRQNESGVFEDATAKAQIAGNHWLSRSAAFVDVDHDGDLDLVVVGLSSGPSAAAELGPARSRYAGLAPASVRLFRNNGNGTFADVSKESGLSSAVGRLVAIAPTDFDNRRDVDLVIAADGHAPYLMKNLRDGTFRDIAVDVGLPGEAGAYTTIAAADVNKDGYPDFYLGRHGQAGVLALSDGRGRFAVSSPFETQSPFASLWVDVDNDGLLDLVTLSQSGPVNVWRNVGTDWPRIVAPTPGSGGADCCEGASLAAGDVDGDGDTDLLIKAMQKVTVFRNEGGSRHASLAVALTGRVSNRSAIGSKVELRAGSLRSRLETSSATPAVAPADLVFGLGNRTAADVVRVLWPAGILQAEIPGAASADAATPSAQIRPAAGSPQPAARKLSLTELDRKPSSCPYLFTWNGERFEFITDFMGGGEMGYQHAPGVVNTPDPEEYTRIAGDKLRLRDGRYELRVTNELEEALFIDRLELLAIDHPANVEVHPREGLVEPPFPPFELYSAADVRPPLRAIDDRGRDVLDRVRDLDRRFVDDLPLEKIRGYAKRHGLTIDVGAESRRPNAEGRTLLLLTGWTDYAFSSDNIAAHQAGLALEPPSLQVKDAQGVWRTVVKEIGVPVGRPQTVVVDLTGKFLSPSREVRIVTSMRIYWDQVRVATVSDVAPRVQRLEAAAADLRWRGFSAEVSPDGKEPFGYDYSRASTQSPWKVMPGRYTREGDVRELLRETDDFFVVSRPGDELALSFSATKLAPLPDGWTRTFLLHSIGYSKEMDRNSASPDQAWPLPFRTMTRYPYAASEAYPDTPRHREYLARWNTRIVGRSLPPIELITP